MTVGSNQDFLSLIVGFILSFITHHWLYRLFRNY
jgi:hypothetical protein